MRNDSQIEILGEELKGYSRILFWGAMGVGKSTLALELAWWFGQCQDGGQILTLDPGSPAFGVPGALNRGWWEDDGFRWAGCQALCSLNAARFRLPLVQAAGRLLEDATAAGLSGPLVIDPPGVIRGVAGAELLVAIVKTLCVDAVVALIRADESLPMAAELAWLPVQVFRKPAASMAARPSKQERAARRTSLWDTYLGGITRQAYPLEAVAVIGTPPPRQLPAAWIGRQAALLDSQDRTLGMGEVVGLEDRILTLRVPADCNSEPTGILIRDAGRNARGCLETIPHITTLSAEQRVPVEMVPLVIAPDAGSASVFSRVGPAWATLVGGVFGDPLVHVRLRNQRRSFLFDLGDPARLASRIAHQVTTVCLSHAHLDHIGGFLWFLRARIGMFGPCQIFGPDGIIKHIDNFLGAITWDRIEDNAPVFEVGEFDGDRLKRARLAPGSPKVILPALPVENGLLLAENNLSIKAVVCDHKIPSLAYALTFRMEISVRKDQLKSRGLVPGPWLGRLKQCIAAETPPNHYRPSRRNPEQRRRTGPEINAHPARQETGLCRRHGRYLRQPRKSHRLGGKSPYAVLRNRIYDCQQRQSRGHSASHHPGSRGDRPPGRRGTPGPPFIFPNDMSTILRQFTKRFSLPPDR